jgi:hypothetical protein
MWLAAIVMAVTAAGRGPAHAIDHVGIGSANLDTGIAFVAERTGVTAARGGVHPGRGTQNALMSLGGAYLEIIAPTPDAPPGGETEGLRALATPQPVFFAVRSNDLEATARLLSAHGFETTTPRDGSRRRPDGSVLRWRTMDVKGLNGAPFFIQWDAAAPHPSTTSPWGCTLRSLEIVARDPAPLRKLLESLGLEIGVRSGEGPSLGLALACPRGEVLFGPRP